MKAWTKTGIAIEGDRPDDDLRVLCPYVLALPGGGFRAFYMGHGRGSPRGTKGRILSAKSEDGVTWTKEPGVRLDHHEGAEVRVLSPCVVPRLGGYRMYYEAVGKRGLSVIKSAIADGAFTFTPEEGARIAVKGANVGSPRALILPGGAVRLYFHVYPQPFRTGLDRGNHVVSAVAHDGVTFEREPGVRIAQTIEALEREAVYCAQPIAIDSTRVRVFYGAWNGQERARGAIMTAVSNDGGTTFRKHKRPCVAPDGDLDATFASEPCVYHDAEGRLRMLYEASDARGATRILGAVAPPPEN
jgi:hypothetical protein